MKSQTKRALSLRLNALLRAKGRYSEQLNLAYILCNRTKHLERARRDYQKRIGEFWDLLLQLVPLLILAALLAGCRWPGVDQHEHGTPASYYRTASRTNAAVDMYHWPAPNPVLPPRIPKVARPLVKSLSPPLRTDFDLPPFIYPPGCSNIAWDLQYSSNLVGWITLAHYNRGCGSGIITNGFLPGFYRLAGRLPL